MTNAMSIVIAKASYIATKVAVPNWAKKVTNVRLTKIARVHCTARMAVALCQQINADGAVGKNSKKRRLFAK
jgi:hypothetical protein